MRITTKGQVTIPLHIREKLEITPATEIDFIEEKGKVYIIKKPGQTNSGHRFRKLRGAATVRMTTDEIMALTRVEA